MFPGKRERSLTCLLMVATTTVALISGSITPVESFGLSSLRPPASVGVRRSVLLYMGLRGKRVKKEKRRALQEPTPPRIQTPYGPIRIPKAPKQCDCCNGRGMVRCNVCEGRGVIRKTGTRKTNAIQMDRAIGTKWTSVEIREGHRQYHVTELRGSKKGGNMELRMSNCCGDPVDFWIGLAEIKNKSMWRMGWTTLEEIRRADGGALLDVRLCFRCKGDRVLKCVDCDGQGVVETYEPLHN